LIIAETKPDTKEIATGQNRNHKGRSILSPSAFMSLGAPRQKPPILSRLFWTRTNESTMDAPRNKKFETNPTRTPGQSRHGKRDPAFGAPSRLIHKPPLDISLPLS